MSSPNSGSRMPSSFDENEDFYNENGAQKLWRRIREEPLIPIGVGVTIWALTGATRSMRKGDHKKTNLFFRRRLYAQAFTIAVMVAGNAYWQGDRQKRKDYQKKKEEDERLEKRARWVHELEVRDEEEKAFQEKVAKRKEVRARERAAGVTEMVAEKTQELKERAAKEAGEVKEDVVGKK